MVRKSSLCFLGCLTLKSQFLRHSANSAGKNGFSFCGFVVHPFGFRASPGSVPPHLTHLADLTPMPGAIPYDLSRLSKMFDGFFVWKRNLCDRQQKMRGLQDNSGHKPFSRWLGAQLQGPKAIASRQKRNKRLIKKDLRREHLWHGRGAPDSLSVLSLPA